VPRLTGPVARRLRGHDRGGVMALVAILLSSGALLAATAYAVDIGTLYAERSQLLSGANSAAMAAAQECTRPGGVCGSTAQVQPQLNGNAVDGKSDLDQLCGVDTFASSLGACSATTGAAQCVAAPPSNTSYAEVHAGTKMPDNDTVYPPSFAGAAVPGYTGTHVRACSRVAWGPPQGPYAPFALSKCQFDIITGGMATPGPKGFSDPYPTPSSAGSVVPIDFQEWNDPPTCGGFAYLNHPPGTCATAVSYGGNLQGTVDNNNGSSLANGNGCTSLMSPSPPSAAQPYLLIPIYTAVGPTNPGSGATTLNSIVGIAAFLITGRKLTNGVGSGSDWLTSPPNGQFCGPGTKPQSKCVRGYFVFVDIIDGSMPASGWHQTFGVSTFKTVG
jgi:hypothetical protein